MPQTEHRQNQPLTLINHHLCPYVQRAVIALEEKQAPYTRVDIDLANKPDWFNALSPLGRVPVLRVGEAAVFESAVIVEYLEETISPALHPGDALARAEHRSWIEFASTMLADVGRFYNAPDARALAAAADILTQKFTRLETRLGKGRFFAGNRFSLVDAAFAPLFRYFDTFDVIGDFGFMGQTPRLLAWRTALAERASVKKAAPGDYHQRLLAFLARRKSHLATLVQAT